MSNPRLSPLALCLLLVTIVVAAAFSYFVVAQRYWLDDSFISYRYAWHLVHGHGLVYNPGEPVEGYTNFLWTLVSALGIRLGCEPIYFTQAVSLGAQGLTLAALFGIGRAAGHGGLRALFAPVFLAGSIAFLAYPMTGMETSFVTLQVTVAALLIARRAHASTVGGALLGLVLLGLGLTRFDGFVLVLLLASWPLVGARLFDRGALNNDDTRSVPYKRWLLPLGLFVLGLALYNAWRLWFYPTPLPNTFYAKTSFNIQRFEKGIRYLRFFALGPGLWALVLGLLPLCLLRASSLAKFLGWVVLGQFGYVAIVGGDWMPHFRFLLPILPLLFCLMQEGWVTAVDAFGPTAAKPRLSALLVAGLLFTLHLVPLWEGRFFSELEGPHFSTHDAKRIGEHLQKHLPGDQLIAMEWGGIIPYYAPRLRSLDTYGLTDREIVQLGFQPTVWGRKIPPGYLKARGVDLVAPCARILTSRDAAIASVQPGGQNHYSYYPQLSDKPNLGYRWRMIQLAEDAWWPALVADRRPTAAHSRLSATSAGQARRRLRLTRAYPPPARAKPAADCGLLAPIRN